jgi:protein-arginine deiminase
MVNLLVAEGKVIVPQPFGPKDGQVDKFQQAFEAVVDAPKVFIDSWVPYHIKGGEVHCGTNVRRQQRELPKWWNTR